MNLTFCCFCSPSISRLKRFSGKTGTSFNILEWNTSSENGNQWLEKTISYEDLKQGTKMTGKGRHCDLT